MLNKIKSIDARYLFLFFFIGVFVDAFCFKIYMKSYSQLGFSIIGALGTDILINRIKKGRFIFPLSGLISSCGTFILISSPYNWPFLVLGALAIYSKHFIVFRGKHIFNPVNFGAALTLYYLHEYVQGGAGSWSGNFFMIPYLTALGCLLVWKAGSLPICLSYLGSFFLTDLFFLKDELPVNIASFASPPFFLFVFFMISDPATTPRRLRSQLLFGFLVAAVEGYFKLNRVFNGGLWSLLVVSLAFNFLYPLLLESFLVPIRIRVRRDQR